MENKLGQDIVYQIYPKSFQDSTGSGTGDLKGVISRLDYLADLGINFIWLNPFYVSPGRDNGYDVADYRSIDPRYGTMEDFEELVAEAGKRGIGIMLDMVFNHTSTEHEWFKKALANDPKYRDYYIWKDPVNGHMPTNWESKFGGPVWEFEPKSGQYYLHLFDPTQADLNWENPEVRKECADIVRFWMDKGVKGFRFDVVNLISKGEYKDDFEGDGRRYYSDGPRIHEFLRELNRNSFGQNPELITVGEMSSTSLENSKKYANLDGSELSMVFSFHHLKVDYRDKEKWTEMPFDFMELKKILFDWQTGMQEGDAWNALFLNCHDQPRSLSRFGDDRNYPKESAKMLGAAMQLMRGTPYIYQGEEIGMTNAGFTDIEQYRDVESINHDEILRKQGLSEDQITRILQSKSRDNARTPMQWDDSENAGFTDGTPWIEVNKNYPEINVKKSLDDPDSVYHFYKKLIALRKENETIQNGTFTPLLEEHPSIFAYKRTGDDEEIIVLNNFYGTPAEYDLGLESSGWKKILGNYPEEEEILTDGTLKPYETLVISKSNN